MRTYIAEIIPRLKQYSQKLNDLTLLTNQHWVVLDEIATSKVVYIFRTTNNELLISQNGKVEKAKWEHLGQNSILIDRKNESYLFKHGFFDENILALKFDGDEKYAFLVNESKYGSELNSVNKILKSLENKYLNPKTNQNLEKDKNARFVSRVKTFKSNKGEIEIELYNNCPDLEYDAKVYQNGEPAADGKYKLGIMKYIHIKDGEIIGSSIF